RLLNIWTPECQRAKKRSAPRPPPGLPRWFEGNGSWKRRAPVWRKNLSGAVIATFIRSGAEWTHGGRRVSRSNKNELVCGSAFGRSGYKKWTYCLKAELRTGLKRIAGEGQG